MIGYADDNYLFKGEFCSWKGDLVAFIGKVGGVVIKDYSGGFSLDPIIFSITF